jgi:Zn-dependent protease with chaperone function
VTRHLLGALTFATSTTTRSRKGTLMSAEWYLMSQGVVKGPVTAKQLRDLAEARQLSPSDRVKRNDGPWVDATRVKGLFDGGTVVTSPEEVPLTTIVEPARASLANPSPHALRGVTSIKQCISRDEKKKRSGAFLISGLFWLFMIFLVFSTFGIVLVIWLATWVINRLLAEYNVRKLQAVGTVATADQFPEVARELSEICEQFGVTPQPKVIVLNSSEVNAFALRFARKKVIVLLSETLDGIIDEPGQLRFILAHELCHLVLDDSIGGKFLVYRPAAFKAARELTCDNCGTAAAGDLTSSKTALKRVGVGNKLYPRLNEKFLEVEAKYIYSGITGWLLKQYLTYPPLGRRITNVASFHQEHA